MIRKIAGMPDYEAHLKHLRTCHPDAATPTEREYFDQFLRTKSGNSGSRCC
ncbi:MAG TPA: YbdD/YjiX family protein [Gemmatimonadales bacterium]|nr:YbdD/YjiX family protein [Gemmatimonadales bacterium]